MTSFMIDCYPDIHLERLWKTTRNFSQDSNPVHVQSYAGILTGSIRPAGQIVNSDPTHVH
jgi:hypothetical protein